MFSKRVFFWVLILLLNEIGIIFLVLPLSMLQRTYGQERRMVAEQLGEHTLNRIESWSAGWFRRLVVDTGVMAGSYHLCQRQGRDRFDDRGLGGWVAKRLDVFWLAVWHLFFRMGVMAVWLPVGLVFALPIFGDGLLQREIRKHQFSYSSPLKHRGAVRLIDLIVAAAILMPLLPVSLPPQGVPLALGLCGAALWIGTQNLQKRI